MSALVTGVLLTALPVHAADRNIAFSDSRSAYKQGISGYRQGNYEIAEPALRYAASHGVFAASYYLAKIYADHNGSHYDPGKSFRLFKKIVDQNRDVDPDDIYRAPIVAGSWTAIGRYVRTGLPAIGLKRDLATAVRYFYYAATMFDEEDAQFELARLQLTGSGGVKKAVPQALNWFAALARKGHAGAQAFLADLYWQGKYIKRNPEMALALINIAVENASPEDQVWIDDAHQNIFCSASGRTKHLAGNLVVGWRNRYLRPRPAAEKSGLDTLGASPTRTCANGDVVRTLPTDRTEVAVTASGTPQDAAAPAPGSATAGVQDIKGTVQKPGSKVEPPRLFLGDMSFTPLLRRLSERGATPPK